jgi:hypothetical protein
MPSRHSALAVRPLTAASIYLESSVSARDYEARITLHQGMRTRTTPKHDFPWWEKPVTPKDHSNPFKVPTAMRIPGRSQGQKFSGLRVIAGFSACQRTCPRTNSTQRRLAGPRIESGCSPYTKPGPPGTRNWAAIGPASGM